MISKRRAWAYLTAAFLALSFGVGFAMNHNQPYCYAALHALQTANIQLSKVAPDKGGHRVKAMELINQALREIKAGMADDTASLGYAPRNFPEKQKR